MTWENRVSESRGRKLRKNRLNCRLRQGSFVPPAVYGDCDADHTWLPLSKAIPIVAYLQPPECTQVTLELLSQTGSFGGLSRRSSTNTWDGSRSISGRSSPASRRRTSDHLPRIVYNPAIIKNIIRVPNTKESAMAIFAPSDSGVYLDVVSSGAAVVVLFVEVVVVEIVCDQMADELYIRRLSGAGALNGMLSQLVQRPAAFWLSAQHCQAPSVVLKMMSPFAESPVLSISPINHPVRVLGHIRQA